MSVPLNVREVMSVYGSPPKPPNVLYIAVSRLPDVKVSIIIFGLFHVFAARAKGARRRTDERVSARRTIRRMEKIREGCLCLFACPKIGQAARCFASVKTMITISVRRLR